MTKQMDKLNEVWYTLESRFETLFDSKQTSLPQITADLRHD